MSARDEALAEIAALARAHGLTQEDVRRVLDTSVTTESHSPRPRQGALGRVFAYLGGTLVLAGLCVLVGTLWGDLNTAERLIVSLGSGLVAYTLAYMASLHPGRERLVTPLFLIAAFTQPVGLAVALQELTTGRNEALGTFVIAGVMALQCVLLLARVPRSSVVFVALTFGSVAVSAGLALVGIEEELNALLVGVSLFLVTVAVTRTEHEPISPFWYFVSSGLILGSWFELVERGPAEVSELALIAGCIYLSTVLQSRTLLATGTLALLVYVGYFSGRHFADSVGWPLLLILLGALMMGLGTAAVRIHRRYIKPRAVA
jgi:hypothetical protein